jgi:hypothetical protein
LFSKLKIKQSLANLFVIGMQTSVGNVYDLVIRMYSSKNETLAAICKSSTELIEFMNSVNSLGNVKDYNCLCFFLQRIL